MAWARKKGSAWTTWTPQVVQQGNVSSTNYGSKYIQIGKLVTVYCRVRMTQAGSAGSIFIVLPVVNNAPTAPPSSVSTVAVGSFTYTLGASPYTAYAGSAYILTFASSPRLLFRRGDSQTSDLGSGMAIATNDDLSFTVTYEAA